MVIDQRWLRRLHARRPRADGTIDERQLRISHIRPSVIRRALDRGQLKVVERPPSSSGDDGALDQAAVEQDAAVGTAGVDGVDAGDAGDAVESSSSSVDDGESGGGRTRPSSGQTPKKARKRI